MKELKIFLLQHGWEIIEYNNDTTFLHSKIKCNEKNIEVVVEKRLGVNPLIKTKWIVNDEVYTINSNDNEKFIFEELNKLGFN